MKRLIIFLVFLCASAIGFGEELSKISGVTFSGSPSYISEFPEAFRDNGGPLSPYGSHIGLKADVESRQFASVLHFACATGKNVLDYSRTGLFARSSIRFLRDGRELMEPKSRAIKFEYYGWRERAEFDDFSALAYVQFLGLDQYVISFKLENKSSDSIKLSPVFSIIPKGRSFKPELRISSKDVQEQGWVFKFSVKPTITPGANYLGLLFNNFKGSKTEARGVFEIKGDEIALGPGEKKWMSFIFGYEPDSLTQAYAIARDAKNKFSSPESAWKEMVSERDRFFASLPKPHLGAEQKDYLDLYLMAVTALDNALYAPRGNMKYWGCVPTKVHYNWFWLWDSGFQALGYSEFKPDMARDVIRAIFQAQRADGYIAHMEDERAKPITPHSQSPVFGFSGSQIIERFPDEPATKEFEKEMYEKGKLYIDWWKKARDQNNNGLFEYLSQDEGGWDNSPRMNYVKPGPFISYVGSAGEVISFKLKPLDNADLNPWMYFYYEAMARWADDLAKPEEAIKWRADARALAQKIDEVLWDEDCGCWLDTYGRNGNYRHFKVLTPAIWFPAFAGATLDEHKARAVIEKHLLNPEEFFGKYPIPTVAYNDPYFDASVPGWKGRIWIFSAYSALETLFKFGYEKESDELRERLLSMMANQGGMKGIYETYDPITGRYLNHKPTSGYASFQFGWSSAFTIEMILERYQHQRFIFADTNQIQGFIREAQDFETREVFYQVNAGLDVPRVELQSADGSALLKTKSIKIKLTDPYQALTTKFFKVLIKGKAFELELGKEYEIKID